MKIARKIAIQLYYQIVAAVHFASIVCANVSVLAALSGTENTEQRLTTMPCKQAFRFVTISRTRKIAAYALAFAGWTGNSNAIQAMSTCSAPFASPEAQASIDPRCPAMHAPPGVFSPVNPYRADDASFSQIDVIQLRNHEASLAPVRHFTSMVSRYANRYVESGGEDFFAGTCVLKWLQGWAEAGALTDVSGHMAQYSRSVALSSWAISYAQVSGIKSAEGYPRASVLLWFSALAQDTIAHYDQLRGMPARNNHRYWAALAAYAVGAVTHDEQSCAWGLASARIGLDQIDAQGALPLELSRKSRSRSYHLYATGPLVLLSEYAAHNGVDLYGYRQGALHRLIAFAIDSVFDSGLIERLTGTVQVPLTDRRKGLDTQALAFFEFYEKRFPGRSAAGSRILAARPLVNAELGGNLTMLSHLGYVDLD